MTACNPSELADARHQRHAVLAKVNGGHHTAGEKRDGNESTVNSNRRNRLEGVRAAVP
jgi:hypothetical protein